MLGRAIEVENDRKPIESAAIVTGVDRWAKLGVLFVVVALAAVVRWHHIGRSSIWIDEGASITMARLPWRRFLEILWQYEANMTTYYLLLRAWMRLGDSEIIVRGLSALCGTATVLAVYYLGRRLFGARTGLLASALLSVHTFHVWLSQEARSYSLAMLLVTLSLLLFVEAVESPERRWVWLGYMVASVLAAYAHLFALLVVAAQWLGVGPRRLRRIGLLRGVPIALAFAVLLTPLAAFVLRQDQGQVSWIPPISAGGVLLTLTAVNGFNPVMMLLALLGLVWSLKDSTKADDGAFRLRLVGLAFVFPIIAVAVASIAKPLFFFRYFAICVPAAVLLAARTLSPVRTVSRGWRITGTTLAILTLGISGALTYGSYSALRNWGGDWRWATEYVLANRQPGDALVFYVSAGLDSYRYYEDRVPSGRGPVPLPTVVFPGADELASAHLVPTYSMLKSVGAAHPRLWVVLHQKDLTDLPAPFPEPYRLIEEKSITAVPPEMRVTVALYETAAHETAAAIQVPYDEEP